MKTIISNAIAKLNADKVIVSPTTRKVAGSNFMTPRYLGSWQVEGTNLCIEISEGTYFDGSPMLGLTVFDKDFGKIQYRMGKSCIPEDLFISLQELIGKIYASNTIH